MSIQTPLIGKGNLYPAQGCETPTGPGLVTLSQLTLYTVKLYHITQDSIILQLAQGCETTTGLVPVILSQQALYLFLLP